VITLLSQETFELDDGNTVALSLHVGHAVIASKSGVVL
jgi:hypothetical protein